MSSTHDAMRAFRSLYRALLLVCVGTSSAAAASVPPASTDSFATPNDFLKRSGLTFVAGTAGGDRTARATLAQIESIRAAFPGATLLNDQAIDVAKGAQGWPANPVLYGGPHSNSVLARLAPALPFAMERGRLRLGSEVFEGDDIRLIAVIPAHATDARGPDHPEFLLYAGTGSPGVAEINAVRHGAEPILVADTFGRLLSGTWQRTPEGALVPVFPEPRARRIGWRAVERTLAHASGSGGLVQVRFPAQLPPAADEQQVVDACMHGLATAVQKLELAAPVSVTVYVYPDRGSKRSLTGDAGDGKAEILAHAVHVIRFDPAPNGPLERLLTHEGTHMLLDQAWGTPGSALFGEGLAVWASGSYGGVPLQECASRIPADLPPLSRLLGPQFRRFPEQSAYPLAGLLVDIAVKQVGLGGVRDHLYGATAATWEAACREAGTTSAVFERLLRERLVRTEPKTQSE
jgi:hypothetical protein